MAVERARRMRVCAALLVAFAVVLAVSAAAADSANRPSGAAASGAPAQADASPTPAPTDEAESIFTEAAGPLGLTDAQLERLEVISTESRAYGEAIRAELKSARADMKQLLDQDEPEFAAVMSQADEIGKLETRMRKHYLATLLSLREILSPEQRENLVEVLRLATLRKQAAGATKREAAEGSSASSTKGTPVTP